MWEITIGVDTFVMIILVAVFVGAIGIVILLAQASNR
jgi:NADH:ubiquinone oxidoreductase subunit 6 (subunit J)